MKQLTIQQWFARAVAAGLMPEWNDIIYRNGYITNTMDSIKIPFDKNERIQLRKNNKDLYSLEWRKPTEQDVGEMCWFKDDELGCIALTKLSNCDFEFMKIEPYNSKYLLADHPFPPTEADFKRIYGE